MTCSNIVRAPRLVWDGAQERPLDPGGPAERGRFEDNLLEDAHQLIHLSERHPRFVLTISHPSGPPVVRPHHRAVVEQSIR